VAAAAPVDEDRSTRAHATAAVLGYQPALDGIRAVAIVMVLLFHTIYRNKALFAGGYLGVDAFFVLSGFLITTLLLQEARRWRHVSLRRFYVRRALRLLPLAGALALTGALVNLTTSRGFAGRPWPEGVASVLFYFANWMHLWQPSALGFMGHAWSLAIEEQFYLLWPPLLVLLLWRRVGRWPLLLIAVALACGSAALRAYRWYTVTHPGHAMTASAFGRFVLGQREFKAGDHIYYSSFTHADGLLIGCALAVLLVSFPSLHRVVPRFGVAIATAGVVAAGVVVAKAGPAGIGSFLSYWGLPVFELGVAAVTAAVVLRPRLLLGRALGNPVAVWVGRRSYGLYVIHGAVFTLLAHVFHTDGVLIPAMWGLTFALAALSFRFLETPILRLKDRFSTRPVTPSLAT